MDGVTDVAVVATEDRKHDFDDLLFDAPLAVDVSVGIFLDVTVEDAGCGSPLIELTFGNLDMLFTEAGGGRHIFGIIGSGGGGSLISC